MMSVIRKGLTSNLHFIGVILFFILHGYATNYPLIPIGQLILLLFELLAGGFVLYWLSEKILRSKSKAGLFTSFTLVIILFFVPFQRFFATYHFTATFSKLGYFLTFCIVAVVIAGIWLKKSQRKFVRSSVFINTLLAIYLVVECCVISGLILFPTSRKDSVLDKYHITVCDTCKKIPVYLIVPDEHIGFEAEREYLDYFDTSFAAFLHNEGFYLVPCARSNYPYTIFSMSSMLNMRYHEKDMGHLETFNHFAYNRAQEAIRDNAVCEFFEREGYRIVNNSIWNLKNAPEAYTIDLPSSIRLITSQTIFYQVAENLPRVMDQYIHLSWLSHRLEDQHVNDNEVMMARTLAEARKNNPQPAFTYVHLLMPHPPFAFDSAGHHTYNAPLNKEAYAQYLSYTDKRLTRFIQELKQATKGEAAILLLSDHGVRIVLKRSVEEAFCPLSAIYLPQKNYHGWYSGISHVNQFRVLFNTLFHQSLPMLPDTISFQ